MARPGHPTMVQTVVSDMGANGREVLYNVGVGEPVSPACAEASADKPMPLYREVTHFLPPAGEPGGSKKRW